MDNIVLRLIRKYRILAIALVIAANLVVIAACPEVEGGAARPSSPCIGAGC